MLISYIGDLGENFEGIELWRKRTSRLPDATGVGFDELVRYLQTAADQIKLNAPSVAELLVFGIRCSN